MGYMGGRLVNASGATINVGDKVTSFRGEVATVQGWFKAPDGSASTGRIHVIFDGDDGERSFYPSVFECKVV